MIEKLSCVRGTQGVKILHAIQLSPGTGKGHEGKTGVSTESVAQLIVLD